MKKRVELSMNLVVEAYRVYYKASLIQPYDRELVHWAYYVWRELYEKLAEKQGIDIANLPMPTEKFYDRKRYSTGAISSGAE